MAQEYTVVGYYEDNDQRFCDTVIAASAEEAESLALDLAVERGEGDLVICGTFLGKIACVDTEVSVRYAY